MLSIISAKNRTFAHIQPITFPFLIPSSACFLYSVPCRKTHIRSSGYPERDEHLQVEQTHGSFVRHHHGESLCRVHPRTTQRGCPYKDEVQIAGIVQQGNIDTDYR